VSIISSDPSPGMAPSAAIIIATAALAAVFLQALVSWTPAAPVSSASGHVSNSETSATAASSAIAKLVPHEERPDGIPKGWANLGPSHGTKPMALRIALKSADVSGLQRSLLAVSTPGNAQYGRHLTADEVRAQSQRP
jgi:hypothetical protein